MQIPEIRNCRKCGKAYIKKRGGVAKPIPEYMDGRMCRTCTMESRLDKGKKVLAYIRKIPYF